MTKDEWKKRQGQWDRFHQWEEKQPPLRLSPMERIAGIGALIDLAWKVSGRFPDDSAKRDVSGIILMRHQLSVLDRVA
ncbi:MAG: hypothetical protein HY594_03770 [Candidatus Omnitrophica bacterium]|nr:hypothetical protein [Candidatus Omnitrophota bacterium]